MLTAVKVRLRTRAGRLRRDFTHVLVRDPIGGGAFGIVGSPHVQAHFARRLLGLDPGTRVAAKLGFHRDCSGFVQKCLREHGAVVASEVDLPRRLAPWTLRVPNFVSVVRDLEASEEELRRGLFQSAQKDLRKVQGRGYSYSIERDAGWAQEFHDRYHAPSVRGRHGEEGYVMAASDIAREVRDAGAEFLKVEKDGACVAALLASSRPEGYAMGRMGWLDADPAWPKDGAVLAVYWFTMLRALELGQRRVCMGGTPPYVEDGVMTFKGKWGGRPDRPSTYWGDRFLILDPAHASVRTFLGSYSIIGYGAAGDFVVFSARAPGEVRMSSTQRLGIAAWYCLREQPCADATSDAAVPLAWRSWFSRTELA